MPAQVISLSHRPGFVELPVEAGWGEMAAFGGREQQLVFAQGTVAMREPQPAEQLRVVPEALVNTGHADEHDRHTVTIVDVAQHLQGGGRQTFCLINNDQLGELLRMFASDMIPKPEIIKNMNEEEKQDEN